MAMDLRNKGMVGEVGRCIYCGAHGRGVELTDEHVIPYSLGSNAYLKVASCRDCADITKVFEQHVARNIYGHLRIHLGIQTRRIRERPTELPIRVIREGVESRLILPINEHPFFLILPVWDTPGMLRGEPPQKLFTGLTSHLYYSVPPTIQATLGVADFEPFALAPAEYRIDAEQFAKAIAKIAYCAAIERYGVDGFKPFAIPDLILGKLATGLSYFVGSSLSVPPPPEPRGRQHRIDFLDVTGGNGKRVLMAHIRLFADSGTVEHGTPVYTVVLGTPEFPAGSG